MSGWDVSSTPTWGSQDGPDETQAFTASGGGGRGRGQDFGAPDFEGGYPEENMSAPEYPGQEYGQDHDLASGSFPQRTPGQSFQDLPRRDSALGRHDGMQDHGYGQDNGYDNGYGQDNGYGREGSYGQDGAFGQDAFGQDGAFGQDWGGNGADQGDSWGRGGQEDGGWGHSAGRSAPPWDERSQRDAGFGDADAGGFGRQEFGHQPDGFPPQEYAGQGFPGHQDRGGQPPMDFGRQDRDLAARNDPALQDFFAPAGGGSGFSGQGSGWSGGGEPPRERFRPADEEVDWTGRPKARPAADPDVDWTGRPRGQRSAPRLDDDEDSGGGIGMKGLVAIGAVVVVVLAAAAYMFMHKGSSSTPTAGGSSPSAGAASSPAAKPSGHAGSGTAGGGAAAPAYTMVSPLPATAGGYPLGQDPNDLANAKATAQQIVTAVSSGGGGTVKGSAVSGAYTLPASQAMTFIGYQGTFDPTKIKTILKSLGTDPNTYSAGPDGGVLGCINTTTTPSGAVCLWATSSTLGITEFYDATGPETLNAAQPKGAADALKLRADLEKKA